MLPILFLSLAYVRKIRNAEMAHRLCLLPLSFELELEVSQRHELISSHVIAIAGGTVSKLE